MPLPFDELNQLQKETVTHRTVMSNEKYFGEMKLPKREIEKRIELAEKLHDSFFFVLVLLGVLNEYNRISYEIAYERFKKAYEECVAEYIDDPYIADHVDEFAENVAKSTMDNLDDPYFFSDDRATFISQNESNNTLNYEQYIDAIRSGKTLKTWNAIIDKRTRKTHREINGRTIPIDELFLVGINSLMRFPGDYNDGLGEANEIINCRCSCTYR